MPPHPLTNFEIQKSHENKLIFNGAYSRNNLSVVPTRELICCSHDELKRLHFL